MKKTILRNWTLFLAGEHIEGAHEYNPPELSIITTNIRTGGMDSSTPHDDGMEALTASFKFYGLDTTVLSWFGFQLNGNARFSVRSVYMRDNRPIERVDTLEGLITKLTPDAHGNSGQGEAAITGEISLKYYKSVFDGQTMNEIDPERFIRIINGVNVLEGIGQMLRVY